MSGVDPSAIPFEERNWFVKHWLFTSALIGFTAMSVSSRLRARKLAPFKPKKRIFAPKAFAYKDHRGNLELGVEKVHKTTPTTLTETQNVEKMVIEYDPVFVTNPRSVIGFSFDPELVNEELEASLSEEGFKLQSLPESWAYTNKTPPLELLRKGNKWNGHQRNYWKYLARQKKMGEATKVVLPYIKEGETFVLPIEN